MYWLNCRVLTFYRVVVCSVVACSIVVFSGLWAQASWAGGNFAATVPVVSQAPSDRKPALAQALAEVLVKVSGDLTLPVSDAGMQAMRDAGRYVSQFRYLQPNDAQRMQGIELLLRADFDAGLVTALIQKSGATLWPENRPEVLIWAIADTPQTGRNPITEPNSPILAGLLGRAETRGLPILLPLWDLEDQVALDNSALWALDDTTIMAASQRYAVNTVLAARYSQTSDGRWFANWQLHHLDEQMSYDAQSYDAAALGLAAIDPVASYLAQRYAVSGSAGLAEKLQVVHVSGLANYSAYQEALMYWQALPLISAVKLVAIRDDHLVLHIALEGDWQQLNNALALDRKVKYTQGELDAMALSTLGTPESPARYRWVN